MNLIVDLEPAFQWKCLKPFDHDDGTIICWIVESFADQICKNFQPKN